MLGAGQAPATQQAGVRTAPADMRPLGDQLLPGDKVVEFFHNVDAGNPVLPNHPPSQPQALAMALSGPEEVVLVQVETADARLIDKDRWIATRLGCRVIEVLRAPSGSRMGPGSIVSFEVGGGEVQINGVLVRTNQRLRYEVGRKYLTFLKSNSPGMALTSTNRGAYQLLTDGERLRALPGGETDLDGFKLTDVRRAAAKKR